MKLPPSNTLTWPRAPASPEGFAEAGRKRGYVTRLNPGDS